MGQATAKNGLFVDLLAALRAVGGACKTRQKICLFSVMLTMLLYLQAAMEPSVKFIGSALVLAYITYFIARRIQHAPADREQALADREQAQHHKEQAQRERELRLAAEQRAAVLQAELAAAMDALRQELQSILLEDLRTYTADQVAWYKNACKTAGVTDLLLQHGSTECGGQVNLKG